MEVRNKWDRERVTMDPVGPSLTKQSMKAECDINNILKGYLRNGVIEHVRQVEGRYGNFIGAPEYHDAMNQIVEAQNMFDTLPANIRKRFSNDPAEFLSFAQDESNEAEMRSMGLLPEPYQERDQALSTPAGGDSGAPSNPAAEESPPAGKASE